LLNGDLFPIRQGHHLDDQKKICFIVIELWPLIGIGDVFQQQRVENKLLADRLEYLDVVDPADVDPDDRLVGGRRQLVGLMRLQFLAAGWAVAEDGERDVFGPPLPDVDKRPRRQAGFF
jgi:hypothetical protein